MAVPTRVYIDGECGQLIEYDFREYKNAIDAMFDGVYDKYHSFNVTVFNKTNPAPRTSQFASDEAAGYTFSRQFMQARATTPEERAIMSTIESTTGFNYNAILYNRYRNGTEKIGSHSDDEREIVGGSSVMIISRGATRKFRIRKKDAKGIFMDIPTRPYRAIAMIGEFQKNYKHEVPEEKTITTARESASFRAFLTRPPARVAAEAAAARKRAREERDDARASEIVERYLDELVMKVARKAVADAIVP
jgi:alkylated DNA repair dioxygenase AlkB